ncbi:MAG: hypothetical protein NTX25_16165 [Proteobacteria bacterium]|nr:hypothetical protein [Pseudomonadota bacterium]
MLLLGWGDVVEIVFDEADKEKNHPKLAVVGIDNPDPTALSPARNSVPDLVVPTRGPPLHWAAA